MGSCCSSQEHALGEDATSHANPLHQVAVDPAVLKLLKEDPLMLGLTVIELRRRYESMRHDDSLLTPPALLGMMAPINRAEADDMVAMLEAAGGEYKEKFQCPAYRVLTDKHIKWEGTPPGTPIGEVVKKHFNGYDGLEVRGGWEARVW